jgi:glycosyltransferase involved in cell wall biosynthesis
MKNILYIGSYKDNNGMGQSCRRFIDFLANDGKNNLAIRPLYLTQNLVAPIVNSDRYVEYENSSFKNYDTVIYQTFPDYLESHKYFGKNVAIVEIETMYIKHSGWIDKLNLMDEVWVGSTFSAESLLLSGLNKPIRVIPEPYNISNYKTPKDSFFNYDQNNNPYIFYTIGQYSEKKNIKSIIMAYLLEFSKNDNVKLFIKTYDYRKKNEDLENIIKYDISVIKNIIRKSDKDYADIDILCGYMKDNDINRLHQSANCYINAVRGDSFPSCSVESALCNKLTINTKNTGSSTYFNSTNSLTINSVESTVLCSNSYIKNIYTMNEQWREPSINDLRYALRKAYSTPEHKQQEYVSNFDANIFSYDHIKGLLDDNIFYSV